MNSDKSKLSQSWKHKYEMTHDMWIEFFTTLKPVWDDEESATFNRMRVDGPRKLQPEWRGRLINPNFSSISNYLPIDVPTLT